MPLLKIWNAIWGRTAEEKLAEKQPEVARPAVAAIKPVSSGFSNAVSSGLSLFGSNPHAALCKMVAASQAQSVLEVGVGDGSRAIAVVGTLAKRGMPVRYFGVDEFELAGGTVSLKEFHRTLRSAGIRPQIFPEPVDRGLVRFLHTVGHADLVMLSEPGLLLEDPRFQQLLSRVSHGSTTVLYRQDDVWARLDRESSFLRRAA